VDSGYQAGLVCSYKAPNAEICLAVDASNMHIGAALQQREGSAWRPLAFFSKKLVSTQLKYSAAGCLPGSQAFQIPLFPGHPSHLSSLNLAQAFFRRKRVAGNPSSSDRVHSHHPLRCRLGWQRFWDRPPYLLCWTLPTWVDSRVCVLKLSNSNLLPRSNCRSFRLMGRSCCVMCLLGLRGQWSLQLTPRGF
jgi:hypothetical protein